MFPFAGVTVPVVADQVYVEAPFATIVVELPLHIAGGGVIICVGGSGLIIIVTTPAALLGQPKPLVPFTKILNVLLTAVTGAVNTTGFPLAELKVPELAVQV